MAHSYDYTCHTLTSMETPDPFMTQANGVFYFTFTAGNRIEVWSSRNLKDFQQTAKRSIIWTPPPGTDHSADLWAPELHALRGRWYVYYAAAHPAQGNRSHRMYVLGGPPSTENPTEGQWEFLGRIHGMHDHWAIDGTVFELNHELFMVYSGWPLDNHHESDLIQQLFIMKLEHPTTAGSPPVVISAPELPWEFTHDHVGAHGINEGPQFLESLDGSWRGIVYSCAGSWTHEYKMAVLHYNGGDPLDPRAWPKGQDPLIQAELQGQGPWGPGHGNFLNLGGDTVCVFHATDHMTDGWNNRRARCQQVTFTESGPYMGLFLGGRYERPKGGLIEKLKHKLGKGKEIIPQQARNTLKSLLG
ncbi:glycosyl hydrolase [Pseudomassariella vexata]|uniref:Glycosyl hydrolase n=1 Tax=Pseudomassariella vexata TaxID=1141098 RepID=A0A1Y2D5K7_9PEZI|nr:glycosyl hydrolase [Pseudomassariella vexata]ORY54562.1 glycosyl hydrolase [Pseudomassariella vexata]